MTKPCETPHFFLKKRIRYLVIYSDPLNSTCETKGRSYELPKAHERERERKCVRHCLLEERTENSTEKRRQSRGAYIYFTAVRYSSDV